MADPLDRQDLIGGLREVIRRAWLPESTGISIRIVGGAALRMARFERAATYDIDATLIHFAIVTRSWVSAAEPTRSLSPPLTFEMGSVGMSRLAARIQAHVDVAGHPLSVRSTGWTIRARDRQFLMVTRVPTVAQSNIVEITPRETWMQPWEPCVV